MKGTGEARAGGQDGEEKWAAEAAEAGPGGRERARRLPAQESLWGPTAGADDPPPCASSDTQNPPLLPPAPPSPARTSRLRFGFLAPALTPTLPHGDGTWEPDHIPLLRTSTVPASPGQKPESSQVAGPSLPLSSCPLSSLPP